MLIYLDKNSPSTLTEQIVQGVQKLVDNHGLQAGWRMPSIRRFGADHGVSRFTVVQAYDRLVASGYLQSRPGSGFYVTKQAQAFGHESPTVQLDPAMDVLWLLRNALGGGAAQSSSLEARPAPASGPLIHADNPAPHRLKSPGAGEGWLPASWLDSAGIQRAMRSVAQQGGTVLTAYGTPQGYAPLRRQIAHQLSEQGVYLDASQVVLTHGATQALDLVARYFIQPGDVVLVDEPGYFILYGTLKSYGAQLVGVPWRQHGPDFEKLQQLVAEHKPRLFFTNSVLHNPTGATISQGVAYRVLQLAEKHDMIIVEDDVYSDFHPARPVRLASLDQLERVIYIGSYSKTISSAIRVGFVASNHQAIQQLTDTKLLSLVTTSETNERMVYEMLVSGYYRKHIARLQGRLQKAREVSIEQLNKLGMPPYLVPEGGMFIWVDLPAGLDAVELASRAAQKGVVLAPGYLFNPHHEPSNAMRFNVASCYEHRFIELLKTLL